MPESLHGQIALVTGASGGIGSAIARSLFSAGAQLILHYGHNREAVEALGQELGRACLVQADLRSLSQIQSLASAIPELDILINNAGVWKPTPLGSAHEDTINEMLDTNLRAAFWLASCVSPKLRNGARIVNVSSVAAQTASSSGRSLYRATKAAIDSLTRNWALELAPRGIRVNAVAPGIIETSMTASHLSDEVTRNRLLARHPLGRFTTAEEVADAVLFLCTAHSRHVTGQILNVSGGFVV